MNRFYYESVFFVEDLVENDSWVLKLQQDVQKALARGYQFFMVTFKVPADCLMEANGEIGFEASIAASILLLLKEVPFTLRDYAFDICEDDKNEELVSQSFLFKIEELKVKVPEDKINVVVVNEKIFTN